MAGITSAQKCPEHHTIGNIWACYDNMLACPKDFLNRLVTTCWSPLVPKTPKIEYISKEVRFMTQDGKVGINWRTAINVPPFTFRPAFLRETYTTKRESENAQAFYVSCKLMDILWVAHSDFKELKTEHKRTATPQVMLGEVSPEEWFSFLSQDLSTCILAYYMCVSAYMDEALETPTNMFMVTKEVTGSTPVYLAGPVFHGMAFLPSEQLRYYSNVLYQIAKQDFEPHVSSSRGCMARIPNLNETRLCLKSHVLVLCSSLRGLAGGHNDSFEGTPVSEQLQAWLDTSRYYVGKFLVPDKKDVTLKLDAHNQYCQLQRYFQPLQHLDLPDHADITEAPNLCCLCYKREAALGNPKVNMLIGDTGICYLGWLRDRARDLAVMDFYRMQEQNNATSTTQ